MATWAKLSAEAKRLAETLAADPAPIVFAESCTGGLVSAALAGVPGISQMLCGSAVVYRIDTKAEWLGVSRKSLVKPGPVSRTVAEQMAVGVLERTPEARIAASITGHLGPDAPKSQDGLLFIACAQRPLGKGHGDRKVVVTRHRLPKAEPGNDERARRAARKSRQIEAALLVLSTVHKFIKGRGPI
jgi:nicotinamide-nucleotide amidase